MRVIRARKGYVLCALMLLLVLGTVFLVLKRDNAPVSESKPSDDGEIINNETVKVLVSDALMGNLPVKKISATIYDDGRIAFCGAVSAEDIRASLETKNKPLSTVVRMFSKALPEETDLCCELRVALNAEDRCFDVRMQKLVINGVELSGDLIPASAEKELTDRFEKYLKHKGIKLGAVEFRDGAIMIKN